MVKLNSKYIRELLGSKGMAVADLAYHVGVAHDTMKRILDREVVPADLGRRIADTLCVPIVEITLAG